MFQKIRDFLTKLLFRVDDCEKQSQNVKLKANEKANEIIDQVKQKLDEELK